MIERTEANNLSRFLFVLLFRRFGCDPSMASGKASCGESQNRVHRRINPQVDFFLDLNAHLDKIEQRFSELPLRSPALVAAWTISIEV